MNKKLEQIAKEYLRINDLTVRKSDDLDFHEVSVWDVKVALQQAYRQGVIDATVEAGKVMLKHSACSSSQKIR